MVSDPNPPDFAMQRAVDILAGIFERAQGTADTPVPLSDTPIVLFNESLALDINTTTGAEVRKKLGIGFSYPALGWHTYCVRAVAGRREFLSLFYSQNRLVSAELYYPKVERAPKLEPVGLHFRFSPGELSLGAQVTALPQTFRKFSQVAHPMAAYGDIFEARYPGGAAYAMGNHGIVERLALYVLRGDATPAPT